MKNVLHAKCVRCGRTYEAIPTLTTCQCGGILDIVYDYDYIKTVLTKEKLAARRDRSWQRNLLPTMTHSGLMLPGLGAVPAGDLWRWKRPYPWQTVCRIPCMG